MTFETAHEPPEPAPNEGGKFGTNMVYSRSIHFQESNLPPLHKVTIYNPINSNISYEFVYMKIQRHGWIKPRPRTSHCSWKGNQNMHSAAPQQPLYPLSNFLSFEKFSPTHKTFLTNLNCITTHSFISEALFNR